MQHFLYEQYYQSGETNYTRRCYSKAYQNFTNAYKLRQTVSCKTFQTLSCLHKMSVELVDMDANNCAKFVVPVLHRVCKELWESQSSSSVVLKSQVFFSQSHVLFCILYRKDVGSFFLWKTILIKCL